MREKKIHIELSLGGRQLANATTDAAGAAAGILRASLNDGSSEGVGKGVAILAVVLNELGGQNEAVATRVAHLNGVGVLDARNALGPIIRATGSGIKRRSRRSYGILDARRLGDDLK